MIKITREVKEFGMNGAHVTLPKSLIGKHVQVIVLKSVPKKSDAEISKVDESKMWFGDLSGEEKVRFYKAYKMINGGK